MQNLVVLWGSFGELNGEDPQDFSRFSLGAAKEGDLEKRGKVKNRVFHITTTHKTIQITHKRNEDFKDI